jgi:hypothetical protein
MESQRAARPIHPTEARYAFGQDRDHRAIPGTIKEVAADRLRVALLDGGWFDVTIDDPRFAGVLDRDDLCSHHGEQLVLLNPRYGLIGVAYGVSEAPRRLTVLWGVCRLEYGTAVEIPGEAPQPGWLLFRCTARPVPPS